MGLEVSDEILGAFVPIAVYWLYSGIYCVLGLFCDNSRLQSKNDENQKNLVTKSEVVRGVLFLQTVQAVVAIILFEVTGGNSADSTSNQNASLALPVPAIKIFFAMFVMDTWHHLMHRLMHHNKFLYKRIHSKRHKLTVPYSFGALYSSHVEGFLLDTLGGALSFLASGMTPRISIFFFSFATIKTVDDHCGLWLPRINPFHKFFYDNAAYHNVHHQFCGSKYNFSQPFSSTWDRLSGTSMPYSNQEREDGGFEARLHQD